MGQSFLDYLNLLHAQEVLLRMQGNPVLFQMNRVWNCFCCWRESSGWRNVGKLKVGSPRCEPHPLPPTLTHMWRNIGKLRVLQIRCRYICLDLKLGNFHLCCSWHHFVEGFFSLVSFSCIVARSGAVFVISVCSWCSAILGTGSVYIMRQLYFELRLAQ